MADKFPFFAAEGGTWQTASPNPHIHLSGTALTLGTYPVQTFAQAAADTTIDFATTNTCTIVAWVDATHWARYEGAVWTDASPDVLDLSAATLMGVGPAGGPANDEVVSVVASLPSVVADASITLAKLANLAQDQFIGRTTASTGVPETATITAAARTVLDDTTVAAMRVTMGLVPWSGIRFVSPQYLVRNSGDVAKFDLVAGSAIINGSVVTWTSTLTSSAGGSSGAVNATGIWYLYIYDSSGAVLEISQTAPTWDADLDYWKLTGGTKRCVGWGIVWQTTGAAYRIWPFTAIWSGRSAKTVLHYEYVDASNKLTATNSGLLYTTTAVICSSVQSNTLIPTHATSWLAQLQFAWKATNAAAAAYLSAIAVSGSYGEARTGGITPQRANGIADGDYFYFPASWVPIVSSRAFYYGLDNITGTNGLSVVSNGAEIPL